MKYKKFKDQQLRKQFSKNELKTKIYKIITINFKRLILAKARKYSFKLSKKKFAILSANLRLKLLFNQPRKQTVSKTMIKNRCIISNRNKSVIKTYSISRLKMLEYLKFGILPGYKKAAW